MNKFSASRQMAGMLAVWEELEKLKAAAQTMQDEASTDSWPRLMLVPKSPPATDPRNGSAGTMVDQLPVALPNTPPKLRSLPSSSSSSTGSPSSARSSPRNAGSDLELPDLPDEVSESLQSDASSASNSNTSPTPGCGLRRRSLIGEEGKEQVRAFRRRVSRRLSKLAEDMSGWVQKASPRSGRNSPERSSPAGSGRSSPVLGSPRQKHPLSDSDRSRNAVIDLEVDLSDPKFLACVTDAADAAFIKPWSRDSADTTDVNGNQKSVSSQLQPTFIRDFGNSHYCARNADGSTTTFNHVDEFAQWVGAGKGCDLPRVVSNVASQNLGNFLKNSLFLRHDDNKDSQSILRLWDGTPVMPLAVARASYVFGKDRNGDITLDYCWQSNSALNSGKLLKVKQMTDYVSVDVADQQHASLRIDVRVTIARDGEWHIGNPRVQASGWNVPASQ